MVYSFIGYFQKKLIVMANARRKYYQKNERN